MGTAVSVGLGLALAQPDRRELVLEGDGALLMGLNGLATIGRLAPPNLACLVWDNQALRLTGGRPSATGLGTDLAVVGRGVGIVNSRLVSLLPEPAEALDAVFSTAGPSLLVVKVGLQASGVRPPRRPAAIGFASCALWDPASGVHLHFD